MFKKLLYKILQPRHYWRTVSFDELSEIYAAQFLRSLAVNLVGIFVPVYLYKLGYPISSIMVMYLAWFASRIIWAYVAARLIAKYGPKHSMAIAVALQVAYLSLVISLDGVSWPLWFIGVVGSLANGLYLTAFEVDFSKVKHTEHGGKELGYLQIFERIGAIIGPLIGGIIASFFDPRYTIAIAIFTLCGSMLPLFMSDEPTRKNQTILVKGFPYKKHIRDFAVSTAFTLENVVSLNTWPLFLGAFVLLTNTYAAIGVLASVSTVAALLSAYIIGKLIDEDKGKLLLNTGAYANAIVHIFRPFVTTMGQALAINLANEPLTTMYRMPFLKGKFDASDQVPGYRIVYYMLSEIHIAIGNVIFWFTAYLLVANLDDKFALQLLFVFGAIMSIAITRQRYSALR
jgi:MFS family permease